MRRTGVSQVRFPALFWRTLEPHRDQPYYRLLRERVAQLVERKSESTAPVSKKDSLFTGNPVLAGIWHYALFRTPDLVLFYVVEDGEMCLSMFGSHADYPYLGKGYQASQRTSTRIRNAVDSEGVASPLWRSLSWSEPRDLIGHPDLPELAPAALDLLAEELEEEMRSAPRYGRRRGVELEDTSEDELQRYLRETEAAADRVMEIRDAQHRRRAHGRVAAHESPRP